MPNDVQRIEEDRRRVEEARRRALELYHGFMRDQNVLELNNIFGIDPNHREPEAAGPQQPEPAEAPRGFCDRILDCLRLRNRGR